MGIYEQNPLSKHNYIDGGGSSTIFASATQSRWNLTGGAIGWQNLLNSVTVALYETNSTNSGIVFAFMPSTTSGAFSFHLGYPGLAQSCTIASRLMLNVGTLAGTVTGMFTGYSTGGG